MGCTLAKDSAIVSTLPTMGADVPKVSKTDGEKDVSNAVNDASEAKEDTDSSKDKKEDDAIKSEDETKEVDQPEALPELPESDVHENTLPAEQSDDSKESYPDGIQSIPEEPETTREDGLEDVPAKDEHVPSQESTSLPELSQENLVPTSPPNNTDEQKGIIEENEETKHASQEDELTVESGIMPVINGLEVATSEPEPPIVISY